jgi:hypothetical protein
MSTTTKTLTPTRTFSKLALTNELARRQNNKARKAAGAAKARAASWVFPGLTKDVIKAVIDGEVVEVSFKSGRTEVIGCKG